MNITINNVPSYAHDFNYIVARLCEGDWWFWGAYNDPAEAFHIAADLGGACFCTKDVITG